MAAATIDCRRSKRRLGKNTGYRRLLEIVIMPVQTPPITTQPNETHPAHPQIDRPPDRAPAPAGRARILLGAVLLVLITAGVVTFLNRNTESNALAKETEAVSVPTVAVVQPQSEPGNDELILPGNLQAFIESPIFARTNGYLLRWYKDIGSKIEKGELLAAIDTPEVTRNSPKPAPAASRSRQLWDWQRSPPTAGRTCERPTPYRSRRPTSKRAAIS